MLRFLTASLLPVALLASGCARHVGKPDGPPPQRLAHDWTVQRDLPFTPDDWPQPLLADLGRAAPAAADARLEDRLLDLAMRVRLVRRAEAPAAGTIVVDARIIRAVPNLPLRNIAPQSQVGRTGYGYAVALVTLRDGATGQVLVSARESRATSRFGLEKMSEWGSVEKSFDEWAAGAVKLAE